MTAWRYPQPLTEKHLILQFASQGRIIYISEALLSFQFQLTRFPFLCLPNTAAPPMIVCIVRLGVYFIRPPSNWLASSQSRASILTLRPSLLTHTCMALEKQIDLRHVYLAWGRYI